MHARRLYTLTIELVLNSRIFTLNEHARTLKVAIKDSVINEDSGVFKRPTCHVPSALTKITRRATMVFVQQSGNWRAPSSSHQNGQIAY